jgi:hypothetical protein
MTRCFGAVPTNEVVPDNFYGGGADVFDVTSYGAKGDGTTDDTTAIRAAITALTTRGRGRLYFPHGAAGIYLTSSQIDIQTVAAKPDIIVYFEPGVRVKPNADFICFKVKQDNLGDVAFNGLGIMPMCVFQNLTVQPATTQQATGVQVEDSYGVMFYNCEFRDLKVGIHLKTYNSWTEGWVIQDTLIDGCATGLKFEKAAGGTPAGTGSFQAGSARHLHIRNGLICVDIGTGAVVSNNNWSDLQFWIAQTNGACGIYCDGNLDKSIFEGLFEAQGAAAGTRYAFWWGANAVNLTSMIMEICWFSGYVYWSGGNEFAGAVYNPSGINWVYSPPPSRPNISPSTTMIVDGFAASDFSVSTPFTAKVNGNPTSTSVPYDTDTGEGSVGPNMVLRNTTKGKKVKIVSINRTTNTITVAANSPDDADVWDDNDNLTTASATNTGRTGTYVDLDVTAWVTREGVAAIYQLSAKYISGTTESFVILHPWEAYDEAKEFATIQIQAFWQYQTGFGVLRWEGKRAYITVWLYMGAATVIRPNVRYVGQM